MNATSKAVSRPSTPSMVEGAKQASHHLRGTLATELANASPAFSSETEQIIKHHGAYQQDNRDARRSGERQHSLMVRTRLPGGKLTAAQLLTELDLCDELGDGTLRITDRQGFQLHGVLKSDLQQVILRINTAKATTFGACGDVVRNVMCCPAPVKNSEVRAEMQVQADAIARHFALRSRAYYEIWLKDGEQSEQVGGQHVNEEPVYGDVYLPRKFKFAFALPDDNCVDALTHDVGFVALPGRGSNTHFNVYVGGGMGVTPARADTFAAIAQPFALVSSEELVPLAHAIVQVQREFGNRNDRKRARFKYLIADWGLDRFRETLHRFYGQQTAPPEPVPIVGLQDHLGWQPQHGDHWFLGLRVESGRVKDGDGVLLKSALRTIAQRFAVDVRLTPLQDILLCNIEDDSRPDIEQILKDHGVLFGADVEPMRRLAMACPALPTCGLAITESERAMPALLIQLRNILKELNLADQRISIRMTGCPNGCTRPYVAEVGIVGKAVDKYTLYLGGNITGTRLAFKFRDMLSLAEILDTLRNAFCQFAMGKLLGETFGDFCFRIGSEPLGANADDLTR